MVSDLTVLDVDGGTFTIILSLGGDYKFLAMACGIDTANSHYSCIWCKCPSNERHNMEKVWSITDTTKEARTIEEISHLS